MCYPEGMKHTFPSLLAQTVALQPEIGVPLLLEAFRTGKITADDRVRGVGILEHLVSTAIAESKIQPSPLFRQLFVETLPSQWRQAAGEDQGLESIEARFEGLPLSRYLVKFWFDGKGHPQAPDAKILDGWFNALSTPPQQVEGEAPGELLSQCLALKLEASAYKVWDQGSALDPAADGRPAIAWAQNPGHWQRFMATNPDIWAPVGSSGTPLIVSVLQDSPRLRRELRQQALTDLSQRSVVRPEARQWAAGQIKKRLQNQMVMDASQWLEMMRAAGPALVVRHQSWKKIGEALGQLSWHDTLLADKVFSTAIGPANLIEAQYEVAFQVLNRPPNLTAVGNVTVSSVDTLLAHLRELLALRPLPLRSDGKGWAEMFGFPSLEPRQATVLAGLMAPHHGAWWGPLREQTEQAQFHGLASLVDAGKKPAWKQRVETFLTVFQNERQGPWSEITHAFAQALAGAKGKQQLDGQVLLDVGFKTLAIHEHAKASLGRLQSALDKNTRQLIQAALKGHRMDQTLASGGKPVGSRHRL